MINRNVRRFVQRGACAPPIAPPIFYMPLISNLSFIGLGVETYSRATTATFNNLVTGFLDTAAIDVERYEDSYLHEGESTNLIFPSEDLLGAPWDQQGYNGGVGDRWTLTQVADVGNPFGAGTANKLVATATPNGLFGRSPTATVAGDYAGSMWVYIPSGQVVGVNFKVDYQDSDDSTSVTIDTFDEWVNVRNMISTVTGARTAVDFNVNPEGVPPLTGFTFYTTNLQVEALDFSTSYIPTTVSSVTRAADILSVPKENTVGLLDPFTIVATYDAFGTDSGASFISSEDGVTRKKFGGINTSSEATYSQSGTPNIVIAPIQKNTTYTVAATYDQTTLKLYIDNILVDSRIVDVDATGVITALSIGSDSGANNFFFGHIKDLKIYDYALTLQQIPQA